jgi:cytochrome bd-type quinol oxidase subunit 1
VTFPAKDVAQRQPAKLAALEALYKTSKPAALVIGGIPNDKEERVDYAIHIPGFLSYLAHGDFQAEVKGLDKFAKGSSACIDHSHSISDHDRGGFYNGCCCDTVYII